MDYPWAVPGAKVVCVDDRPVLIEGSYHRVLFAGREYQVKSIQVERAVPVGAWTGYRESLTLSLVEVERWGRLVGFGISRFRPLYDLKSDIAKFTHLLNTTDEVVEA